MAGVPYAWAQTQRVMNPQPNNINPPSMVRVAMDPRNPIVYEVPLERVWGRDPGWIQPPDTTGNKNYRPISMGGVVPDPENGYFPVEIPLDDVIDRTKSDWPSFKSAPPIGANLSVLFNYPYVSPPDYFEYPDDTTKKIPTEVNKQPPDVVDSEARQKAFVWETVTTYPRPWTVPKEYKPNRMELSDNKEYIIQPTQKRTDFNRALSAIR